MTALLALILLAAVALAFVRPMGRLVFFVLGILFFLAVGLSPVGSAGLHGEGILFAIPGLAVCVAVILAELLARIARWLRGRRHEAP